jgi:hypothetical protein
MRREKAVEKGSMRRSSLTLELAREAALGVALGLGFCLLIVLIDPSHVMALIAHNPEPGTTAIILLSFFALSFGVGATLTGFFLATIEKP